MATLEIVIKGTAYEFKAGIGFMRDINGRYKQDVPGLKGAQSNVGLRYYAAALIDGDIDALIEVLYAMNKGCDPRVKKEDIEGYIEDVEDIDGLFQAVLDFLSQSNVSKQVVTKLIELVKKGAD